MSSANDASRIGVIEAIDAVKAAEATNPSLKHPANTNAKAKKRRSSVVFLPPVLSHPQQQTQPGALVALSYILTADVLNDQMATHVTKWRWQATNDKVTCSDCANKDGKIYKVDDPNNLTSMFPYGSFVDDSTFQIMHHPRCRCVMIKEE